MVSDIKEIGEWHWRDTMRPARFIMFDARAALLVIMFILHPRSYTLFIFVVALIGFYFLERMGLTFEAALRALRAWLCGNSRPAHIWTHRRFWIDLGSG